MTPADVILIFVIALSIGGPLYFHITERRYRQSTTGSDAKE